MLKSIVLFLLMVLVSSQTACWFFTNAKSHESAFEYSEISKIPRDNTDERIKAFNQYPVEKQIDIYLCATHQSDYVFEIYLMANGESKISKIAEVIKTNPNFNLRDKTELIGILFYIDRNCKLERNYNCVANNSQVMESLKQSESPFDPTDSEGNNGWRKGYSWTLFELQRKSLGNKENPKIKNIPNPYSNCNVNP
jgi:hypothetical protein